MLKSIRISSFLTSILFLAAPLFSQSVILTSLSGVVETRLHPQTQWRMASRGDQLPQGAAIRTGADGRAILLFKNGARIWIKEKSTLDLSEQKNRSHQILLREGAVKARVPHLKYRERFRLRTTASVAAVRGTVLTLETDESGEPSLDVLFGEVRMGRAVPDSDNVTDEVSVPQGNTYRSGRTILLTREEEVMGLEDWSPGLSPEERRKDLIESAQKRDDVRQFSAFTRSAEREIADSQQQVKEEDFAQGRTLVDVHGNVVRVDQRLNRPDNKTLQVVNVVKRSGYASGGFRKYDYNGSHGSRLDSVSAKVEFNRALPESLNELPGFFLAHGDNIKAERSELVFANMGDRDNVFTVAMMGLRDPLKNDIKADLFIGTLKGDESGKNPLFKLRQQGDGAVPGLTKFTEVGIPEIKSEETNEFYGNSAKLWKSSVDNSTLWLASEFFIINNAGKVRNLNDLTNGSVNFESFLKDTAIEIGIFAKQDVPATAPGIAASHSTVPGGLDATNFAGGNSTSKNIDIVIIPDIFVSMVKSLVSGVKSLSESVDSNPASSGQ